MDMSSLVMNGQSFGATISLGAAVLDKRVACSLALDLWMGPIQDKKAELFNLGRRPMQLIESQSHFKANMPEIKHI